MTKQTNSGGAIIGGRYLSPEEFRAWKQTVKESKMRRTTKRPRYTVCIQANGRLVKLTQYVDKAAADKHATSIGGVVKVFEYNPRRVIEDRRGRLRRAGLAQGDCSYEAAKQGR